MHVTALVLALLATWPAPGSPLTPPELPAVPARKKPLKVVVDAGHGVNGNGGNHGCACQLEADVNLEAARLLAQALAKAGPFEVRLARDGDAPAYSARLHAAEEWKADAVVSLHTDARGWATGWTWTDEEVCYRNDAEPGFSVLWSEEGPKTIVDARARLGRAVVRRMREAGFGAYTGVNYGGLYRDDAERGGWIDIHLPGRRIYFLRASAKVPVVIIETHHALDVEEVARWKEPVTQDVFAAAIAAALADYGGPTTPDAGALP